MNKVLIITYHFPPMGGAGAQRMLKFVKYLGDYNFLPVILTPNPQLVRYQVYDHGLLKELPSNARVIFTPIIDLNWIFKILYGLKLSGLVRFINRNIFPDFQRQWFFWTKRVLKRIIKNENINSVLITSPPYSTQLIGLWLKKYFDVPLVIDLRDPLTFNHIKKKPEYEKKLFNFEKKVLDNADFIIANTVFNKNTYINKFGISPDKITVINNGYDAEDFINLPPAIDKSNKVVFSYIGQLYGEYNALPLFNALLKISDKIIKDVEFRFIGRLSETDEQFLKKNDLDKYVQIIKYVPHEEALKYNSSSDYLLLLQPSEDFSCYIPSKAFEYINSKKIIFAIVPENGSTANLIRETGTGIVVSPENNDLIADILLRLINEEKPELKCNHDAIERYERKNLTGHLALVLDKVTQ